MVFSDIKVNKMAELDIRELVYEGVETRFEDGHLACDRKFMMWKAEAGKGHKPFYIFTSPTNFLNLGKTVLPVAVLQNGQLNQYIADIERENEKIIEKVAKDIDPEAFEKSWRKHEGRKPFSERILDDAYRSNFLFVSDPVNREVLLNLDSNAMSRIIDLSIASGYSIDPNLEFVMRSFLIRADDSQVSPSSAMKYNNHAVVVTNTKTGKTSIATRLGSVYTMARVSRLLGFSTADSDYEGVLHLSKAPVFIDELQEEGANELYGFLLELMEGGKSEIVKGRRSTICKSYSPLVFFANPKLSVSSMLFLGNKEPDMASMFQDLLSKITSNYSAFGSRIGLVYFNSTAVAANLETIYTEEDLNTLGYLTSGVINILSAEYSKLLMKKRVLEWLNLSYPGEYVKRVRSIMKDAKIPMFAMFIAGHLESYKHARGAALKLAIIDRAYEVVHNKLSIDEILSEADEKFVRVMQSNLNSFARLVYQSTLDSAAEFLTNCLWKERVPFKVVIAVLRNFRKSVTKTDFSVELSNISSKFDTAYTPSKVLAWLESGGSKLVHGFEQYGVLFNPHSFEDYFVVSSPELLKKLKIEEMFGDKDGKTNS